MVSSDHDCEVVSIMLSMFVLDMNTFQSERCCIRDQTNHVSA